MRVKCPLRSQHCPQGHLPPTLIPVTPLWFSPAGVQPRKGREGSKEEKSHLFIIAQSSLPFWGKNALF